MEPNYRAQTPQLYPGAVSIPLELLQVRFGRIPAPAYSGAGGALGGEQALNAASVTATSNTSPQASERCGCDCPSTEVASEIPTACWQVNSLIVGWLNGA